MKRKIVRLHPEQQPERIAKALVAALRKASAYLAWQLSQWPPGCCDEVLIGSRRKSASRLDVGAEEIFKYEFNKLIRHTEGIKIFGEESMKEGLDLAACGGISGVVDVLDGTNNGFRLGSHFASTGTILNTDAPAGFQILANAIVLPGGSPAVFDFQGAAKVQIENWELRPVLGTSHRTDLDGAAIAAVGQSDASSESLEGVWRALGPGILRYNIAGLPMVHRFIDVGQGRLGIDAILEVHGQAAHDSAPLLAMALKAGAFVCTPQGEPITMTTVENALTHPSDIKLHYIAAASQLLAEKIVGRLNQPGLSVAA